MAWAFAAGFAAVTYRASKETGEPKVKNRLLAALIVCVLGEPTLAHAVVIADTGTPTGTDQYRFAESQYFGGEFTIANSYSINGLEAYISNDLGSAGNVVAGIYSDGGDSPGALLFSTSLALPRYADENWYGVFGLDWALEPGTYWVAFVPDANIEGLQRGDAPYPLFSDINSAGTWLGNSCCGGQGWRINASLPSDPNPVPEPPPAVLIGLCLAAIGYLRRHGHIIARS